MEILTKESYNYSGACQISPYIFGKDSRTVVTLNDARFSNRISKWFIGWTRKYSCIEYTGLSNCRIFLNFVSNIDGAVNLWNVIYQNYVEHNTSLSNCWIIL